MGKSFMNFFGLFIRSLWKSINKSSNVKEYKANQYSKNTGQVWNLKWRYSSFSSVIIKYVIFVFVFVFLTEMQTLIKNAIGQGETKPVFLLTTRAGQDHPRRPRGS